MLRHAVLITWKDGTTPDQVQAVKEALDALPAKVGRIVQYTHGPNLGLGEGRSDYGIVADFDSVDDYLHYDTHPYHDDVRATYIRPHMAARALVQFEL
jgi:hypothetical protein